MQDGDWQLLEQYRRRGSQHAFATLVNRHMGLVYHACRKRLRDEHLAEDVAQAVFVLLARRGPGERCPTLAGWLYRTADHACANAVRARFRRQKHESVAAEMRTDPSPMPSHTNVETEVLLEKAMSQLPPADRDVLLMRYYEDRDLSEVGRTLGISIPSAAKRLSRAVARLRRMFVSGGGSASPVVIVEMLRESWRQTAPAELVNRTVEMVSAASAGPAVENVVSGVIQMLMRTKSKVVAATVGMVVLGGGLLSMTVLLAQAPAAKPQAASQAPATQPNASPRDVIKKFADAIRRSDTHTIKEIVFVANPDEERLVQTVCDYLSATGEFKSAVAKQFGPDALKQLAALSEMTPVDKMPAIVDAMADNAQEQISDTEAILESEQPNVTFILTNDGGKWRISTARMTEAWSPQDWEIREGQMRTAGEAMQMFAQKISDGGYANIGELKREIAAMFNQGR